MANGCDVSALRLLHIYELFCAIWYHLYHFKNVKNTHGGVLLLVKFTKNFTKSNTLPWVFFTFFKLYDSITISEQATK